ncbi:DUF4982 domain-containing protein [Candidatus Sumerlaeota bacterium]|nr:DUF4982 domain-containing protein [Candidatus Sumerlaeota bacterium]
MRQELDFSTNWRFQIGEPEDARKEALDDSGWERVHLPHTWNAADTFTDAPGYYRGPGWYRKRLDLPEGWENKRVWIEFGAAFALAHVWLDGHPVGPKPDTPETVDLYPVASAESAILLSTIPRVAPPYMGGFTGFHVDATEWLRQGKNLLAVRVDNTHDPNILPGKESPDFNLYGGLYREVHLLALNPLHVARHGVTVVTPTVSERSATVRVEVVVENEGEEAADCACAVDIVDSVDGVDKKVLSLESMASIGGGREHRFVLESPEIPNPRLWSPASPHLYTARVRIESGGECVDEQLVPFGFRWFRFDRERGFFLNGRPLWLRGMNRHQDYPGLGNAVPERLQVRDAERIREMGGNFVRTSHYPQHPAFLDACDRLGILVYEEIATWQSIGKGDAFADNAERMLREMIARDKNHPSIILWGLMNEHRSKPLFERLHAAAHEADPTRLTVYAENRIDIGKEKGTVGIADVLGINYKLPHLNEFRADLPGVTFLSSEHTNFDAAVRGDLDNELAMVEKLAIDLGILEARPWMAGGALWCMHDYGTEYEPSRPIQHAGVLDAWRIPKEAHHLLRSRWLDEPVIHICGHWTWPGRERETIRVLVVHNCERVELFLNDSGTGVPPVSSARRATVISEHGQDAHATMEHERDVHATSIGNPLEFKVPYAPGVLRAVGYRGEKRIESRIETAGPPIALRLTAHPDALRADGRDVAEITAEIVDAEGRRVPTASAEVAFSVDGPATLHGLGGLASTPIVGGVGRIALRASDRAGDVRVEASNAELGSVSVNVGTSDKAR